MDYLKLINQLKLIRPKLEEAEEAKAITEAIDIIADYEKAAAQAVDLVQKYEVPGMPVKRQAGLYTCPLCGKKNAGRPHTLPQMWKETDMGPGGIRQQGLFAS